MSDRPFEDERRSQQTSDRPSIFGLLGEIVGDLRTLAEQQLRMAVHEIQLEVGRLKTILGTALGLLIVVQAIIGLLLLVVVAALHEYAGLSWILSAGIVLGVLLVGGVGLAVYVKQQLARLRFYPVRTLHTLKEDVRWITQQLASRKM